ncbi:MAG: 3-oxoacyl-[acyl-carrier-protein] reductase [Chloroflexi bacterium]|nr:3-oxoacyl-[acyl-carrier-protein] reductase [Chloroflexota bacterium]
MGHLDGRVAVVTGAGRGIGRGIAQELARRGARVVVNYNTSAEAANAVVADIEAAGGTALAAQANVSDLAAATALMKVATEAYGQVDILVNNAGTTRDQLIMMMKEDDWDTVITTNLKSAWNCCKAAIRGMVRKRYGRIINITSVSGLAGQAGQSNYSASKAGLIGLTRSLAREVAERNITANAVAPGFIPTDMTADLPEDLKEQLLGAIPMKRLGTIEDVAHAVAFLASDEAGYITGHVLTVDGGLVMG